MSEIQKLSDGDLDRVIAFLDRLPDGDRTFIKDQVGAESVRQWLHEEHNHRWLLSEGQELAAMLSIIPGVGWSSHVCELRLVVDSAFRRRGIGRRLARYGLIEALRMGFLKIVVEVVADKLGDIEMFTSIGFRPEALLADQIRDTDGELRDLVILAHYTEEVAASMDVLGVEDAMGVGA
jgi:ribosomal protein S18 acetylase RimI-like enzyme